MLCESFVLVGRCWRCGWWSGSGWRVRRVCWLRGPSLSGLCAPVEGASGSCAAPVGPPTPRLDRPRPGWTAHAPVGPPTPRWTAVTGGYGGPTGEQGSNGRTGVQQTGSKTTHRHPTAHRHPSTYTTGPRCGHGAGRRPSLVHRPRAAARSMSGRSSRVVAGAEWSREPSGRGSRVVAAGEWWREPSGRSRRVVAGAEWSQQPSGGGSRVVAAGEWPREPSRRSRAVAGVLRRRGSALSSSSALVPRTPSRRRHVG